MGFYQDQIVPLLINLAMRRRDLAAYRSRVVPAADGRVLEIGVGSGLKLPFYSRSVERLIGLDPSPKLLSMLRRNLRPNTPSLELIEGSAEAIPLDNNSVDAVVTTWTLCSIPDAARALREVHRVLRSTGHLLFIEHGRAPEPNVRWWQDHLTPAWKRIGGNSGAPSFLQFPCDSHGIHTGQKSLRSAQARDPITLRLVRVCFLRR